MNEVRVLAGVHAARAEPDLPFFLIYGVDAADDPLSFRNLVLHLASCAVVQVKVIPAVAFGRPDDLFAVGDVEAIPLARVLDEGLLRLLNQRSRPSRGRVDLDDAVQLM